MDRWMQLRSSRARSAPGSKELDRGPLPAHACGSLAAPAHLKLLEDVVHVVLDRRQLDREAGRDLLVRAAVVDQLQDLALADGQPRFDAPAGLPGRERAD